RGETLTYAGLDRAADRLARALRRRGVRPEVRVGLFAERSPGMVVALLGILRAGGAYVPLDPDYPAVRVASLLEDSACAAVLVQDHLRGRLPATEADVHSLEALLAEAGEESPAREAGVDPRNAAYVIYTSGSTGTPKGVVLPHAALANHMAWMQQAFPLTAADRVLQKTPFGFDASVWEFWAPLLAGAVLVLAEPGAHAEPARLARAMAEEEVTVVQFVPSLLAAVLEEEELRSAARVRRVFSGGEALSAGLAARCRDALGAEVVNLYGPTEVCIDAAAAVAEPGGGAAVPLGRPVANVRACVLDGAGDPMPVGMAGELYLGGAQVARGYLGRPELTAERFVPDPFAGEPGGRLYRTGDRVRWLDTGELEFLGRVDQQVKVRGFRIEPGEVEAALVAHPSVREAVVAVREGAAGGKRLVAYVVPGKGAQPSPAELREHVAGRLPEPMVPGAFVVLDALPLLSNGKVDRRALPAPETAGPRHVAPRTTTEEILCGIWAEVLHTAPVGVEESFFDLGGHSLLVAQVVSRVRRAFGVELPLRALFEAPTVAAFAAHVEEAQQAGAAGAALRVARVPRDRDLPLSFAQQRLWLADRVEPGSSAYNMPFPLRLRGALDERALGRSLDALVRRHEALRTVFGERDGGPVQVVLPPAPVPVPVVDLRAYPDPAREAERLAGEESLRPFDLATGPLLRTLLLRLGEQDHVLCFTLHHIVSDGWSMDVMVHEVSALYAAFAAGREPALPDLPVQYADYAAWQRAHVSGEALEAQMRFWKEALAGAPPLLEVPTDHPRAAGRSPLGGACSFALPAELTGALRALSRREGTTLFMTVLGAWQALLGRYAGQEDVMVGTPVAGRTQVETEGLIGFFVNMLAVRADLRGDPTWRELLGRVRETALEAYAHQDLPFERLVEELVTDRSLTHPPLFQVAFALHRNAPGEGLSLGSVEVDSFEVSEGAVRFDLELALVEGGEGFRGVLTYRKALFEPETVERLIEHLEIMLESMVADPHRRISEVPLLRGAERARVLEAWNATAEERPDGCVHEMFAEQAARTPGAVAVACGDRALTYAELEGAADRVAHHLRRLGVGPEVRVGICLERGVEMVAAVLGVLKAGGAYVPLDPEYPADRIAFVLGDSGAAVLLTESRLLDGLPAFGGAVVCLDRDREALAAGPGGAPGGAADPRSAAYVIYTSGSTGTPKGVVVEHRSLANFARTVRGTFGPGAGRTVLGLASFAFDIWAFEVLVPLVSGSTVRLLPMDRVRDADAVAAELRTAGAVHAVPALMRQVVSSVRGAGGGPLEGVRRVYVGGDAVPPELLAEMREAFPAAELRVLYGPTETTVLAASSAVAGEVAGRMVGRPLGNVRLYVCDAAGQPQPVGVPGELWIAGAGVARGYLGRPGLTAESFVPDPFGGEPGARLYRTGDRVRWLASGELEFLGRVDAQVKVRGFRIEPGEVEAALLGQAEVGEAVVVARDDGRGERRLVAYVVPEAGGSPSREGTPELWPSVGDFFVYDELIYSGLTGDSRRNARYRAALERHARGGVVLDVGTGADAVLARLAVEAGARRVYAVELMEESYRRAKRRIEALGLEDRVVVLHGDARTVQLPEAVDVCVSEIVESIAGGEGAAVVLNAARRHLKPGGVMIPGRCLTRVAAVTLPDEVGADPAFSPTAAHYVQRIFEQVGHAFDLRLCVKDFPDACRLSDHGVFEDLDFGAGPVSPEYRREEVLTVTRDGRMDGLLLWLRMELAEGDVLDIMEEETAWFPAYFPLFDPGVEVRAGDRIRLECGAAVSGNGVSPDYSVRGAVLRREGGAVEFEHTSAHHGPGYRASPFYRKLFRGDEVPVRAREAEAGLPQVLRERLAAVLPEHMVPSTVVVLERLPLGPTGKVDRRALPEPDGSASAEYLAPRTETEGELAAIWGEVLGMERTGVRHSFFDLGGHSLLATRVVSRIRQVFDVDLPVRLMFEAPTIEALAHHVDGAVRARLEQLASGLEGLDDGELAALLADLDMESAAGSHD
ncbi:MAG TPA: amino acid adenylation domain-containing protein, partial [Longimicrobiaceae bacterium]|nr:amino acid adenylation domain-containing protein [Longimicrobiaceae bacterium]